MPNERQIKLELPNKNSLINCFGLMPNIVKSEIPERISLFSLGRYTKWKDNATTNNIYYTPKIYKGIDAVNIYNHAIKNEIADLYSLNILLKNSLHLKINKSLAELKNNKAELKKLLLYYSELLKYKNRLSKGNFFITSDKDIFSNIKFAYRQINNYNKYIVSPEYLEENLIIIGAKGCMNFDNPIIACPFIDYDDFYSFLDINNIDREHELKLINTGSSWPVVSYMRKHYDNYQRYLNEKMPLKWHFEIFKYPEMFYITLHLNN
jgi:hypothetical protein